jgi:hypothetical protein
VRTRKRSRSRPILFFELFPLFVMIVSAIVGVMLLVADRRARRDRDKPPDAPDGGRDSQGESE